MESCCTHVECRDSLQSRTCRRLYRLIFVTTEPLREPGLFVHCCHRSYFTDKDMESPTVAKYTARTKWGFCVCQVVFKIPSGVNFLSLEDERRLPILCTPEGQAEARLLRYSCCQEKSRLIDGYIIPNFLNPAGFGPDCRASRSPEEQAAELSTSIFSAMIPTCDREVPKDACGRICC